MSSLVRLEYHLLLVKCIAREFEGEYYTYHLLCLVSKVYEALTQNSIFIQMVHYSHAFGKNRFITKKSSMALLI